MEESPPPQSALHRIRMSQLPLKSTEKSVIGELHLTEQSAEYALDQVAKDDDTSVPEKQALAQHVRYTIVCQFQSNPIFLN
jgi:hypothetical protein